MSEQAPVASPRGRLIGHAVLLAAGVVALAISLRLGLWRQNSPGEGLFPFLMSLAMVAFSAAGLARDCITLRSAPSRAVGDRPPPFPPPHSASKTRANALMPGEGRVGVVAAYLGALVFYAGSLEFLGFIVATAIAITFILRFAERYSWLATLALTAGTIIGCHVLFVLWLGAILPAGTLWENLLE